MQIPLEKSKGGRLLAESFSTNSNIYSKIFLLFKCSFAINVTLIGAQKTCLAGLRFGKFLVKLVKYKDHLSF